MSTTASSCGMLFCECDEDPTRKSRERMIVQLEAHSRASSKTRCLGHYDGPHNPPNEKGCLAQHGGLLRTPARWSALACGTWTPLNGSVRETGSNYCLTSDYPRW